jgi:phosphoribosyl 1,2-cyclic phosphate phosphodiesterase
MDQQPPTITLLGTGTSAGVPCIGCECETCTSDDPRDSRLRTSAAIRFVDERGEPRCILIDTSPDLRQQSIVHGIVRCDAVLYTHSHTDHVLGLDELRRFNAMQRSAIPIYAEDRCYRNVARMFMHVFEPAKNVNTSFIAELAPCIIEDIPDSGGAAAVIDLFGLRVTPVRLMHGRLPIYGFRFDLSEGLLSRLSEAGRAASPFPLAWCTDTSAIPAESWDELRGLRTLFLDGLRFRSHATHFTVGQAVGVSHELRADRTYLIHISHDVLHARDEQRLPEGVRFAHDGLTLDA